jgi:hypothetical protein
MSTDDYNPEPDCPEPGPLRQVYSVEAHDLGISSVLVRSAPQLPIWNEMTDRLNDAKSA